MRGPVTKSLLTESPMTRSWIMGLLTMKNLLAPKNEAGSIKEVAGAYYGHTRIVLRHYKKFRKSWKFAYGVRGNIATL